jgi:hypothetical protein
MSKAKGSDSEWRRGFDYGIRVRFLPGTNIPDWVSCTLPALWTDRQLVQKIADELHLQIESLPEELETDPKPRSKVLYDSATYYLDCIVTRHPNLAWNVADGTLRFAVVIPEVKPLEPFDELAGRLMAEALCIFKRIPDAKYRQIMADIDRYTWTENGTPKTFRPIEYLEGECRDNLADWNKKHPRQAHHTFLSAYLDPQFRQGLLRTLYRAKAKYLKAHPIT